MFGNSEDPNDRTDRSRRTVLKTIGGTGLAATALPGLGAAGTGDGFLCSVSIPTLFERDESPLDPEQAGVVNGQFDADGIFMHQNESLRGCGWFGGNCDSYTVDFPFVISWATDADPSDVGEVYVRLSIDTPATSYGNGGWSWIIESTETTVRSDDTIGTLSAEYHTETGIASNLFRPTYLDLEVDFSDSNIADGVERTTAEFATPNEGLLEAENLIGTTDTIYDSGVRIADRLVSINLNTLRKAVRLWAYSPTAGGADMIDPDGLPENAVVSGISAFKDPIEDQQERRVWGEDAVPTVAGPTIVRRS
ncbi:hypothetical protein [Natrinema caseinilyticum]|uniref:hypothetical protein n=1 Tax=Natrinema caseinilyticum TaxID=2961570 RepID=UPI0020C1C54B|nr:hypothetical protein [Natrinema caseinilyticum]